MARGIKVEDAYFFDTYALVEIVKGNPNYAAFKHVKVILTILNIAELHYKILRDFNNIIADELVDEYKDSLVEIDITIMKEANEFKLLHRAKKLSFADAVGYITARRYGLKFLTGDKQFQGIPGVEFVK